MAVLEIVPQSKSLHHLDASSLHPAQGIPSQRSSRLICYYVANSIVRTHSA
jgi:hypothetical protein